MGCGDRQTHPSGKSSTGSTFSVKFLSLQLLEEDKGVGLQRTTMSAKPTAQNDACISSLILGAKCVRTA